MVTPKRPTLALVLVGVLTSGAVVSTIYSAGTAPTTTSSAPPPAAPTTSGGPDGVPRPVDLPPIGADGDRPVAAGPPPDVTSFGGIAPVAVSGGGIPAAVLSAYQGAAGRLAVERPRCGLPMVLLAAIGKVESGHARGGRVDQAGRTVTPILGPVLNGGPGIAAIRDTEGGSLDGDAVWDRAVGPMQFIPGTWATWGADATADGIRDPHNIRDAATAAGRYLCAGGRDLSEPEGLRAAILSYNRSAAYLRIVLTWMATYARGTVAIPVGSAPAEGSDSGRSPSGTPPVPVPTPQHPPTATEPAPMPQPNPTTPGTTIPPETTTPVTVPQPSTAPPPSSPGSPPLNEVICAVDDLTQPVTGLIGTLLPAVPLPGCPADTP